MAYNKKMRLPDGQELVAYNDGNTQSGTIRMDGGSLSLSGAHANVHIRNGANLVFQSTALTIGGVGSIISVGYSGDSIGLDVAGVTYNVGTLTGSPTITGNVTINGTLAVGGNITVPSMSGQIDMTNAQLVFSRDTDSAKIYLGDYGTNTDWLTFEFGDDLTQDRVRFRTSTGATVLDVISNAVISTVNVTAPGFIEGTTALSSKYLGIDSKAADSEKLDGLDSSQFVRNDANNAIGGWAQFTGTRLTIGDGPTTGGSATITGDLEHYVEVYGTGTTYPEKLGVVFHQGGVSTNALVHANTDANTSYFDFISDDTNFQGVRISGNKVWHAGNDGTTSGLDADLLDGLHATSFMRSDAADTSTTMKTFYSSMSSQEDWQNSPISLRERGLVGSGQSDDTYAPNLNFHWSGRFSRSLVMKSDGQLYYGEYSAAGVPPSDKVWHSGNDGSGSGLDADKLDGLDSASFLRSDTSTSTTGDLSVGGHLAVGGVPKLSGIIGAWREGGELNLLGRMAGRLINKNPDFMNANINFGYSTYDNNNSGRLLRSIVYDDVIPNATGRLMRMNYDPARNATVSTSPGYGGFYMTVIRDTGMLDGENRYRAGNRILYRVVAKIPVGRSIEIVSNHMGDGSGRRWISPTAGTGDWAEYLMIETSGQTGTFSAASHVYVQGGTNTAFTWDVSICQMIAVDEVPDVDRAPTLNVGYKADTALGWGEVYSTGKITTDSSLNAASASISGTLTTGGIITGSQFKSVATNASIELGSISATNTPHIDFHSGGGNIDYDVRLIASGGHATNVGTGTLTVYANTLVANKDLHVAGDLTIRKTGNYSTLTFPAQANDPGFIRHYEATNVARMEFSVSDDALDTDYFSFGATPGGTFTENARITAAGSATFKATTLSSLSVSGDATVTGNLSIPTSGAAKEALKIGAVTIGQNTTNATELIITNLSELRFGTATNATWNYNSWGGIKHISGSNTMVIGGPASANITGNAPAPRIDISFEGTTSSKFDGKVVIVDTAASTIGNTTMANAHLLIGTATTGLGMDTNEIYVAGNHGWVGTIGNYDLTFQRNSTDVMKLVSTGIDVTGALTTTGAISGARVSASGGVSIPSSGNVYIGTYGSATASFRMHYNGTDSYLDYNTDLHLRAGTATKVTISSTGAMTVAGLVTSAGVSSSDDIHVSGGNKGLSLVGGGRIYQIDANDGWIRMTESLYMGTSTLRTDGTFHVGSAEATRLSVTGTVFNWRGGTLYSDTGGKVSINQGTNTEHPLHIKSPQSYEGINIQSTADTDISGISFQNATGNYTWHIARSNSATPDLVFYGGANTAMSAITESVRFTSGGAINAQGTIRTLQSLYVGAGSNRNESPSNVHIALGDSDTGFKWIEDGKFQLWTNNAAQMTYDSVTTGVHNNLVVEGYVTVNNQVSLHASHGRGFRFWNSESYKIYMSSTGDTTWGGNLSWISNSANATGSDYHMYFRMDANNRGWAFENPARGGVNAVIEGNGRVNSKVGFRANKFEMAYNETEDSLDFIYHG